MSQIFHILKSRGFIDQHTDEDSLNTLLSKPIAVYSGLDATADSLHVGHLVQIMCLKHFQNAGHSIFPVIGGGTTLIGDPSFRSGDRQMLSQETISFYIEKIKIQLLHFFDKDQTHFLNNAEWLQPLSYLEFLRDIGKHFSVNRMLTAECYKLRLDKGLSFLEFNYMLLQSYDFYYLAKNHNVLLQIGGSDQWGNMVAGIDLIRRKLGKSSHVLTWPLITTKSGQKMGKSTHGAIWLDREKLPSYDYYQFFRNTEDQDVGRFLKLFTFLSLEEINQLSELQDNDINKAKEILAFEATKIARGEEEAKDAHAKAQSNFSDRLNKDKNQRPADLILLKPDISDGIWIVDLCHKTGKIKSKSDARRLIQGGGTYINDVRVTDINKQITNKDFHDNTLILRLGKKTHVKIEIK